MSHPWVTGWRGWAGSLTNPREVFLKELDSKSSFLKPVANSAQQSKNWVLSLAEAVGPVRILVPICGWCCHWPGGVSVCRDLCGRGIPARGQWGTHGQELGQRTDPLVPRSGLSRSKVLLTRTQRESELPRGQATWPDMRRGKANFSWIIYVSWGTSHSQISGVTNREDFRALRGSLGGRCPSALSTVLPQGRGMKNKPTTAPGPSHMTLGPFCVPCPHSPSSGRGAITHAAPSTWKVPTPLASNVPSSEQSALGALYSQTDQRLHQSTCHPCHPLM